MSARCEYPRVALRSRIDESTSKLKGVLSFDTQSSKSNRSALTSIDVFMNYTFGREGGSDSGDKLEGST